MFINSSRAGRTGLAHNINTVVPGYSVLGFSVLPGFRALNAGDGAWSVHKTLFGFSAPLFQHLFSDNFVFLMGKPAFLGAASQDNLSTVVAFRRSASAIFLAAIIARDFVSNPPLPIPHKSFKFSKFSPWKN